MKNTISKMILCISLVAVALSGCGGSDAPPGATPGISMGTVAKSVTGASGREITVNNVTFGIDGATVTLNGDPAQLADVKPGMRVTITGSVDGTHGSASSIEIEAELEGMVDQINTVSGSIVLLGQTVVISDRTIFDGSTGLSGLAVGQIVEVHGLSDAAGVVEATRVEVKNTSRSCTLSGPISSLDMAGKCFDIHSITVDFATARLPGQPLANGLAVKVRGSYTNGILTASSVRTRHAHLENGHAELEGLVANYDATNGTFTLNDLPVQLDATTGYGHGAVSEIVNGVKVEVKGDVTNGILVARKIEVDGDHGLPVRTPATPAAPAIPAVPVTPPVATTLPGKALYDTNCAGCHRLGIYDTVGSAPNLSGLGGVITGKLSAGHNGVSLNTQQISTLVTFVTAN
jgi:hypothetical protein